MGVSAVAPHQRSPMKIHVLGSAAGGGFPQWNCNCPMCKGSRDGTVRAKPRTQSSIAVSSDGVSWALFNASPDILTQIKAWPAIQPARAIRDTGIAAVVLMDSQIDHTTGLFMLREGKQPLKIYCTDMVKEDLTTGNPIFNILEHYCKVDWQPIDLKKGKFEIPGVAGLRFTPVPISSKAPPYSPHRNDPHEGDNLGLVVDDDDGKRLFYSPGLAKIDPHVRMLMLGADCLLVDGTCWTDDEMIKLGIAQKTSLSMGHLPQSGAGGMIEELKSVTKPRRILIHINNTNPILNEDGAERKQLAAAGIEVAYDGMEIDL
jgi:pyrroloquinoline quinone biosynthesis protein B